MHTLARAAAAAGLLVVGAGTALASVAVHQISWGCRWLRRPRW